MAIRLGVNVDHVATVRQARGVDYPDPVAMALQAIAAGADGITVHLREDRRHIQDHDVVNLLSRSVAPVNLEMASTAEMVTFACAVKPQWCCLVPERRQELTTEGGLNILAQQSRLTDVCAQLQASGIRVSLFVDPEKTQISAAQAVGADAIEMHTGGYANASGDQRPAIVTQLNDAALCAHSLGMLVNAGHGLHCENVGQIARLPHVHELNIGHSLVARALAVGMTAAVVEMKQAIEAGRLAN